MKLAARVSSVEHLELNRQIFPLNIFLFDLLVRSNEVKMSGCVDLKVHSMNTSTASNKC